MKDKNKGIIILGAGAAVIAGVVAATIKKIGTDKSSSCRSCKNNCNKDGIVHEYIDLDETYAGEEESCENENAVSTDEMENASKPISMLAESMDMSEETWNVNSDIKAEPTEEVSDNDEKNEPERDPANEEKIENEGDVHVQEL